MESDQAFLTKCPPKRSDETGIRHTDINYLGLSYGNNGSHIILSSAILKLGRRDSSSRRNKKQIRKEEEKQQQ